MCLYSQSVKPLVSDKDLRVFKLLERESNGFKTPYMRMPCILGETIKADGAFPELPSDYSYNIVGSGAAHAFISKKSVLGFKNDDIFDMVFVEAVIKAGTPFYVGLDLTDIAAPEMKLTYNVIGTDERYQVASLEIGRKLDETQAEVCRLLEGQTNMVGNGGVRVGDVLLSDCKTFLHPNEMTPNMEIIGVVGFIRPGGKPQAISLEEETHKLDYRDFSAIKDTFFLEGYSNTKMFMGKNINFPALEYCACYSTPGTKAGDWYLPSSWEMIQTIRNGFFINRTSHIKKLEIGYGSYWTSTIQDYCLTCVVKGHAVKFLNVFNANLCRPFLHLPEDTEN